MFLVISYDISDDRRRLQVANALLDYGGHRVQRSVFECYITVQNFARLQRRLQRLIDEGADSLRFYHLCENCQPKMIRLGIAEAIDEPGLRIL